MARSKRLADGSRLVPVQVNAKAWALAEAVWEEGGYLGPEDYLNAVLNMAMLHELDRHAAKGQGTAGNGEGDLSTGRPGR